MHEIADLRSDTVTRPSPAMRRAMAKAEVGDDVLGDDPTVEVLQTKVAGLFGKEAALYVPSGSMGNSVCLGSQVRPGEEIIAEEWAHILNFEAGSPAGVWGIMTRPLRSDRGRMDVAEIGRWIRAGSLHTPRTAVVALENTHNFHGGAVMPLDYLREVRELTRERGVRLHLDGARIWNAAAATGVSLRDYGEVCDTMSVCLSKGLGAPVGSVVLGPRETIRTARHLRKRLGGGMRQVGILAAAGILAIDTMRERLPEDHANARALAEGMAGLPGLRVDLATVETNIVFTKVEGMPAAAFEERLAAEGVLTLATGADECRFVTHADVDREDIDRALEAVSRVL